MITTTINFENFRIALKQVISATSHEPNHTLNRVQLRLLSDTLEFFATDGNRLRLKKVKLNELSNNYVKFTIDPNMLYNQIKSIKLDKIQKSYINMIIEHDNDFTTFSCPTLGWQGISIKHNYLYPDCASLLPNYSQSLNDYKSMLSSDEGSLKIAFNPNFLIDFLTQLKNNKNDIVLMEIKHNQGGVMLYSANDNNICELLMPCNYKEYIKPQSWSKK